MLESVLAIFRKWNSKITSFWLNIFVKTKKQKQRQKNRKKTEENSLFILSCNLSQSLTLQLLSCWHNQAMLCTLLTILFSETRFRLQGCKYNACMITGRAPICTMKTIFLLIILMWIQKDGTLAQLGEFASSSTNATFLNYIWNLTVANQVAFTVSSWIPTDTKTEW